jgi:hypothetical protein
LWLERSPGEWRLAARHEAGADGAVERRDDAKPPDLEWQRWIANTACERARLRPAMPDRSVVVRPLFAVRILPGLEEKVHVTIPAWVQVALEDDRRTVLLEAPTAVLSRTWFGDPVEGELGYALKTRARREIRSESEAPHRIVCPVRVRNASPQPLNLQRFLLDVGHLRVYDGRHHPWSNGVLVVFRGDDRPGSVEYDDRPPAGEGVGELLTDSRFPPSVGGLKRSFSNLIARAGFDV